MARQQARRQQRERLAGFVLAVLGVVVLVVAIRAIVEPRNPTVVAASQSVQTHPSSTPTPTRSTPRPTPSTTKTPRGSVALSLGSSTPPASTDTAKKTPLVVLNNTTTSGLAKIAAARFQAAGWTVSQTGNLTNDIVSTCAYYDPSADGAQAAAKALQQEFPTIKRVAPKFPELPDGPVVVVLTPDYSSN